MHLDDLFILARSFMARQLDNISEQDISLKSDFNEINADSIDITELIMHIEDVYDVEFPEQNLEKLNTLGDLLEELSMFLQSVSK